MPSTRTTYALILLALTATVGVPWIIQSPTRTYAAGTSFRPNPIAVSSELPAPMRGLYDHFMDQEAPVASFDTYTRYSWRELELSEGVYNYALIDEHLAHARATGKRHAFRVRAMSTGKGVLVPDYIKARMEKGWTSGSTYVPDWNDPDFLNGFDRLMAALASRYRHHPDLGFIDIGGYGNFGEFHTGGFSSPTSGAQPATMTSILRIVDAHLKAFNPDDIYGPRLIMMTDHPDALRYALGKSPRIGWRRDSLGYVSFTDSGAFEQSMEEPLRANLFANRWKTAPVVTEFIAPAKQTIPGTYTLAQQHVRDFHVSLVGNGNTKDWDSIDSTARQAFLTAGKLAGYRFELDELAINGTFAAGGGINITSRWENNGNAPAYEPWVAYFQLRMSGRVLFEAPLYTDFEGLLPTNGAPVSVGDMLTLPANLGGGLYDVHVQVRDQRGYRSPLPLAIDGRQSDGSFRVGQLTLTGTAVSVPPLNLPQPSCTTRQFNGDGSGVWGQTAQASYVAGSTITLIGQSSTAVRGLVATPNDREIQLATLGVTYTVLSNGSYRAGIFSSNNNVSTQWVKLLICTPPSPSVAPTATFTPFPVSPVATRTPTPAFNPCVVVRYKGDGSGLYGEYYRDSYDAGTTVTITARSSSAVRVVYWISDQTPAFIDGVGSSAKIPTTNNYNLGFESRTKNVSTEWIEVRLCPPGTSSTVTSTPSPEPVVTPGAGSCTTRRYYGDGSGTWGQLTKLSYPRGTTLTLAARSSSAVSGVYWIDGQGASTLANIGSVHTTQASNIYYLGFQSGTANRSTEWADLRTCMPLIVSSSQLDFSSATKLYLPVLTDGVDVTPFSTSAEFERNGASGAAIVSDSGDATPTATTTTATAEATAAPPTSTPTATASPAPSDVVEAPPTATATTATAEATAALPTSTPTATASPAPSDVVEASPTATATAEATAALPTSTPTSTPMLAP
jgi:hypothetical protein